MGRHKGSKNRTTLLRELADLGVTEGLDKLDHDALQERLEAAQRVAPPPPPEPVERTVVDAEVAKKLIAETRGKLKAMAEYYAVDEDEDEVRTGEMALIPERIQEHLRKVFFAKDLAEAQVMCRRALEREHIHLMKLWGDGRISGPATADNIDSRAKKAESLAKWMDKQGKPEAAQKYRDRALLIRATPVSSVSHSPSWMF
jgi:hypothetical protein